MSSTLKRNVVLVNSNCMSADDGMAKFLGDCPNVTLMGVTASSGVNLKHDTKDAALPWFSVGDYKKRANVVGGRANSKPSEVARDMRALLERYNARGNVTIEDIIEFHAEFEYIHPFQDGNGRVGRLIALKECLKNNIIPFIIGDSKKSFYYRGLSEWRREKGWLVDTCLDGQDTFVKLLDILEIPHE